MDTQLWSSARKNEGKQEAAQLKKAHGAPYWDVLLVLSKWIITPI